MKYPLSFIVAIICIVFMATFLWLNRLDKSLALNVDELISDTVYAPTYIEQWSHSDGSKLIKVFPFNWYYHNKAGLLYIYNSATHTCQDKNQSPVVLFPLDGKSNAWPRLCLPHTLGELSTLYAGGADYRRIYFDIENIWHTEGRFTQIDMLSYLFRAGIVETTTKETDGGPEDNEQDMPTLFRSYVHSPVINTSAIYRSLSL